MPMINPSCVYTSVCDMSLHDSREIPSKAATPVRLTMLHRCLQVGLVAVRLLGCPLDAAEHAAALEEAAAAGRPSPQPGLPFKPASTDGRVLLPAPTFSPSLTSRGSPNGTPASERLARLLSCATLFGDCIRF